MGRYDFGVQVMARRPERKRTGFIDKNHRMMQYVYWFLLGLGSGVLARMIVRPNSDAGCFMTGLMGMAGSLVGGLAANLIGGYGWQLNRSGFIGSLIGTLIIAIIMRIRKK